MYCSQGYLFLHNTPLVMSLKARNNPGTSTSSLHGQLQKFLSFRHNAGTSTNSSRGQLEEACCQRLNRMSEVLSVGVACSLKGPPSEQIIKLLGTMYRLLKSATLLTKAPQSGSPPAFHTLEQNWACIWHVCLSDSYETPGIPFGISAFHICI